MTPKCTDCEFCRRTLLSPSGRVFAKCKRPDTRWDYCSVQRMFSVDHLKRMEKVDPEWITDCGVEGRHFVPRQHSLWKFWKYFGL